MTTIESESLAYLREVVKPEAGITQLKETRRAFYAGTMALFSIVAETEHPETLAESLMKEFEDFKNAVQQGKA